MAFEKSYQSLDDQNSNLCRKSVLFYLSLTINLEDLDSRHGEVMDKHLNLLREKDLMINQVKGLEDTWKLEKEQHETPIHSYKSLLCTSENKISTLQEENHHKEKQIQCEQHNLIYALVENFILQKSLFGIKESNFVLYLEAQEHLVACKSAETLTSEHMQEILIQRKKDNVLV